MPQALIGGSCAFRRFEGRTVTGTNEAPKLDSNSSLVARRLAYLSKFGPP